MMDGINPFHIDRKVVVHTAVPFHIRQLGERPVGPDQIIVLLMPLPTHRSDPSKEKQKYYREIPKLEQVPVIIQL